MALKWTSPQRRDVRSGGSVKIEGLAELKAAFEQLGKEVSTKIGVRANRKAANLMKQAIVAIAPVGTRNQVRSRTSKKGVVTRTDYGHLNANIRVRRARAKTDNKIVFHINTGNAFWGYFLEHGTVHMPARPFMRPAFDATRQTCVNVQIAELKVGIERVAKAAKKGRRK